jgi:hypothetical protein
LGVARLLGELYNLDAEISEHPKIVAKLDALPKEMESRNG